MYKKYKGENYKKAHDFFGLKKGDGLILHHKDINLINEDVERYNEWRIEDLVVLTREEHAYIHHKGRVDGKDIREKRISKLRGGHWGAWYKNETLQINKYVKTGETPPDGFVKGRIIKKETVAKMSESRKGQTAWNKGKPLSEKHRENLSKSLKGREAWNKGTHGLMNIWNKGKTGVYTEETRRRISESLKGNNNRIKNKTE